MKYVCEKYLADTEQGAVEEHEPGPDCRVVAVDIVVNRSVTIERDHWEKHGPKLEKIAEQIGLVDQLITSGWPEDLSAVAVKGLLLDLACAVSEASVIPAPPCICATLPHRNDCPMANEWLFPVSSNC